MTPTDATCWALIHAAAAGDQPARDRFARLYQPITRGYLVSRWQVEAAAESGERAVRRVELLRLRFQEGMPIRDIAAKWNEDAAKLHHEFAIARDEFRIALRKVVAFQMSAATEPQLESACRDVLNLL